MAAKLRSVSEGESAPRRKTVAEAAEGGDRRELLVAMRQRIAKTVTSVECQPRDLAALTRRLQEIAKDIDQIDAAGDGANSVVANTDDEPFDATSV